MVKLIEVKNFKSISDLKIDLGRINVFIGENGSGKSNILEAIAFGAAACDDKLDKQFLTSRGIRVSDPKLMRNAFEKKNLDESIGIKFTLSPENDNQEPTAIPLFLNNKNEEFSKWENKSKDIMPILSELISLYVYNEDEDELENTLRKESNLFPEQVLKGLKIIKDTIKDQETKEGQAETEVNEKRKSLASHIKNLSSFWLSNPVINKFKIYAPENTFLRKFEDDEAADPLGIKGQGLFKLLHYFQNQEDKKYINQIKAALSALDWFEDFSISNDLAPGERKLSIKDRFLDSDISISQNSSNEGFLFILFYISLFVSEDAPAFFAIDNLDASFNPKLCKHITKILVKAAKDNDKQALFTTHNPFILDGLDLTDDEQRLFVVYRGRKGNTVVKRITPDKTEMQLSEQWMNGFLGGLPKNF